MVAGSVTSRDPEDILLAAARSLGRLVARGELGAVDAAGDMALMALFEPQPRHPPVHERAASGVAGPGCGRDAGHRVGRRAVDLRRMVAGAAASQCRVYLSWSPRWPGGAAVLGRARCARSCSLRSVVLGALGVAP
jgi:hypothetical protein